MREGVLSESAPSEKPYRGLNDLSAGLDLLALEDKHRSERRFDTLRVQVVPLEVVPVLLLLLCILAFH